MLRFQERIFIKARTAEQRRETHGDKRSFPSHGRVRLLENTRPCKNNQLVCLLSRKSAGGLFLLRNNSEGETIQPRKVAGAAVKLTEDHV